MQRRKLLLPRYHFALPVKLPATLPCPTTGFLITENSGASYLVQSAAHRGDLNILLTAFHQPAALYKFRYWSMFYSLHSVSTLSIILTKRKRVNVFQKHLRLFTETLWNNLHFSEFTKSCCFQDWLPIRFPVPVQVCQSSKIPLQDYSHYYALSLTSTIQIHFYICKKLLSKNIFILFESKNYIKTTQRNASLYFLISAKTISKNITPHRHIRLVWPAYSFPLLSIKWWNQISLYWMISVILYYRT